MEEATLLPQFIGELLKSGPVVIVLLLWIWNQDKKSQSHLNSLQDNSAKLIDQLQKERLAYIAKAELHMAECDKDRQMLREELVRLSHDMISKMNIGLEWPRDPPTVKDIRTQLKINQDIISGKLTL